MNFYEINIEQIPDITFGVTVPQNERKLPSDKLSFSDYLDLEKRVQQNKSILLPNFTPLGENARVVRDIISRATTYFYSPNPDDRLKCLSVWFELCAFLTQFTLNRPHRFFSKNAPSDKRYIQHALQYIDIVSYKQKQNNYNRVVKYGERNQQYP